MKVYIVMLEYWGMGNDASSCAGFEVFSSREAAENYIAAGISPRYITPEVIEREARIK